MKADIDITVSYAPLALSMYRKARPGVLSGTSTTAGPAR